ncbi:hypothetical protein [Miltoncostaea marina]|uniref:hypothetical protein n=1 Tax=Miltoncostaea marina TaxID=2843215 RepID=UPI001C3CF5CE|nr:hypothetical protein [Miltoncostaea marina]
MIPIPPPPDVLAAELAHDPERACEWIVHMWYAALELEREVDELRAHVADLQLEVGL